MSWGPRWGDLRGAVGKASSQPQAFLLIRCQGWMPPVPLVGRGEQKGGGFVRLLQHQALGILPPHDIGGKQGPLL